VLPIYIPTYEPYSPLFGVTRFQQMGLNHFRPTSQLKVYIYLFQKCIHTPCCVPSTRILVIQ